MLASSERQAIAALIRQEVIPAIGCTEPIAVALCAARARELAGEEPRRIEVLLSANMLKNAMGVGIPGTGGMIGLPIAVALGALCGRSEERLEVLCRVTPEAVERGRRWIDEGRIRIGLKEDTPEKLYIEVTAEGAAHRATAVIAREHTRFVSEVRDGEVLLDRQQEGAEQEAAGGAELSFGKVWAYATESPVDELRFILEAERLNRAAADHSMSRTYGHCVGRTLLGPEGEQLLGGGLYARILAGTAAACDARMAGATVPVMSNSGSGNQGIAATMPVSIYAAECGASEEARIRALTLSHLTVIYIKQSLGRLSALCGCVVAATGSSCGIAYLMGCSYEQTTFAVKNMVATLTGMICDGAKPSCALKVANGVSTALFSALLAKQNHCVTPVEGIIDDDVDRSIRNLTRIGRDGMNETDRVILAIMTGKGGAC